MDLDISKTLDKEAELKKKSEERKTEEVEHDYGDKPNSKNIIIMILIIAGIFVMILGGFKLYDHFTAAGVVDIDQMHQDNLEGKLSDDKGYVYNGFSFVNVDGLWWTEVNRLGTLVKIPLHFGPRDVENITITGQLSDDFNKGNDVYVSIDPTVVSGHYVIAMREISANVGQGINRNSVGACTKDNAGCEDRKILSCKDTQGLPVIDLEIADKPGIELSGTCIKVKGKDYDIIRAANRLLYKWYGVMD